MAYSETKGFLRLALILGAVFCSFTLGNTVARAQQNPSQPSQQASAQTPEQMMDAKLVAVKKITVDSFGDDPVAKQLQAMIINALAATKKFIIVDQPGNNADATLRGSALATTSTPSKSHAGLDVGGKDGGHGLADDESDTPKESGPSPGTSSAESEGGDIQKKGGGGATSGGADASGKGAPAPPSDGGEVIQKEGPPAGGAGGAPKGGTSSIASPDTVVDITVAIRLVAVDGNIIWTATKQSQGTKDAGPIQDVANMIVAQFLSDLAKIPPAAKQ
jgi:hypothetical protein